MRATNPPGAYVSHTAPHQITKLLRRHVGKVLNIVEYAVNDPTRTANNRADWGDHHATATLTAVQEERWGFHQPVITLTLEHITLQRTWRERETTRDGPFVLDSQELAFTPQDAPTDVIVNCIDFKHWYRLGISRCILSEAPVFRHQLFVPGALPEHPPLTPKA